MEFYIHAEKDHLCFYKNSTNQTFAFIRSKVAYFNKYLTSIVPLGNELFIRSKVVYFKKYPRGVAPWGKKISVDIKCSKLPSIMLATGARTELHQTWSKNVLRSLLLGCIWKDSESNGPKQSTLYTIYCI